MGTDGRGCWSVKHIHISHCQETFLWRSHLTDNRVTTTNLFTLCRVGLTFLCLLSLGLHSSAMDINIRLKLAMVLAVIAVEAISMIWYAHGSPWGRRVGDRYFITAIVSDIGLVLILQFLIDNYWTVSKWEDAMMLSGWLTLLFMCLQAPHVVHHSDSFYYAFVHGLHKFSIMFAATFCLVHFKHL